MQGAGWGSWDRGKDNITLKENQPFPGIWQSVHLKITIYVFVDLQKRTLKKYNLKVVIIS